MEGMTEGQTAPLADAAATEDLHLPIAGPAPFGQTLRKALASAINLSSMLLALVRETARCPSAADVFRQHCASLEDIRLTTQ